MPNINECKKNPALIDQYSGCCGFAAVLMHIFVKQSAVLDELQRCFIFGEKFKDIDKSVRVGQRIMRRLDSGIIPDESREDFILCLMLMIIFKEYSKQESLGAWEECIQYSQKFTDWAYAYLEHESTTSSGVLVTRIRKLKDVPLGALLGHDLFATDLSYKTGDLAIPPDVMGALLGMVDLAMQRQGPLANTTKFRALKGKSGSLARLDFASFHSEANAIQQAGNASSVDYDGIILGVGNEPGNRDFEPYDNVNHWVYVPTKPNTRPTANQIMVWTWGAERELWTDAELAGYYPAHAIYLAK